MVSSSRFTHGRNHLHGSLSVCIALLSSSWHKKIEWNNNICASIHRIRYEKGRRQKHEHIWVHEIWNRWKSVLLLNTLALESDFTDLPFAENKEQMFEIINYVINTQPYTSLLLSFSLPLFVSFFFFHFFMVDYKYVLNYLVFIT